MTTKNHTNLMAALGCLGSGLIAALAVAAALLQRGCQ